MCRVPSLPGVGGSGRSWVSPPKLSVFSPPSSQHRDSALADVEEGSGHSALEHHPSPGRGLCHGQRLRGKRGRQQAARGGERPSWGSCKRGAEQATQPPHLHVGVITAPCRAWCCPEREENGTVWDLEELALSVVPELLTLIS